MRQKKYYIFVATAAIGKTQLRLFKREGKKSVCAATAVFFC